jgi:hypothetical protein
MKPPNIHGSKPRQKNPRGTLVQEDPNKKKLLFLGGKNTGLSCQDLKIRQGKHELRPPRQSVSSSHRPRTENGRRLTRTPELALPLDWNANKTRNRSGGKQNPKERSERWSWRVLRRELPLPGVIWPALSTCAPSPPSFSPLFPVQHSYSRSRREPAPRWTRCILFCEPAWEPCPSKTQKLLESLAVELVKIYGAFLTPERAEKSV